MPRTAVIDASPLINLAHLGLVHELAFFFDAVLVPRSVQEEVNKRGRFRHRLNKLYRSGLFVRCLAADRFNVQLLRAELDRGESEALIQAEERHAAYFIGDDAAARGVAERIGRKPVGTLRILARLDVEGRAPQLSAAVRILRRDLRFRASESVLREAMKLAHDPL